MNSKLITTVAIASFLGLPAVASAQDSGWYVRGNVGYGEFVDSDVSEDIVGEAEHEGDLGWSVAAGYDFGNNWRVELDGNTLFNDIGGLLSTNNLGLLSNSDFDIRTTAVMLNAIYDFNNFGRWAPYIGAGLGVVSTNLDGRIMTAAGSLQGGGCFSGNVKGGNCVLDDDDTNIGFQILAGLGVDITDRLVWDLNYRYQNALDADFEGIDTIALPPNRRLSVNYDEVASSLFSTGFRYKFGVPSAAPAAAAAAAATSALPALPVAANADYVCWDGSVVIDDHWCPAQPAPAPAPETFTCSDGSLVYDRAACPVVVEPTTYTCWDNSLVYDLAQCPAVPAPVAQYNNCGPNPVAIFNVDLSATPKELNRLGTMPEFGDSHGLSSTQFYEKLQARYAANQNGDRGYLNYLFKSMGYSNGFADAESYMFSEEVLPVGTRGILGLGEQHHYAYHVLPNSQRDREAFRIQSANGSVVHFMKTCGNYMYACN